MKMDDLAPFETRDITPLEDKILQLIEKEPADVALLAMASVIHALALSMVQGDELKVAKLYQSLADRTKEAMGDRVKYH